MTSKNIAQSFIFQSLEQVAEAESNCPDQPIKQEINAEYF